MKANPRICQRRWNKAASEVSRKDKLGGPSSHFEAKHQKEKENRSFTVYSDIKHLVPCTIDGEDHGDLGKQEIQHLFSYY